MGIAGEPFLGSAGRYIGIDVNHRRIELCREHFPADSFQFQHLDTMHQIYAPKQIPRKKEWEIADESIDIVTALSVWTHLNEEDAIHYFQEIDRLLKAGGKAMVTFFLLDNIYRNGLKVRSDKPGRYHVGRQDRLIFDVPCSKSHDWFHPQWAERPEDIIGVTPSGIDMMLEGAGLKLVASYEGNWKEIPGVFAQDVLVFEKMGNV